MTEETSHWTLDKRIPVSVILALFLQTAAIIVWAMKQESRIVLLERTAITSEQITSMRLDIASVKQDMSAVKEEVRRMAVRGK